MAQTGMNFTRAARELDRRESEAAKSADVTASPLKSDRRSPLNAWWTAALFAVDAAATRATVAGLAAAQRRIAEEYEQAGAPVAKMLADTLRTANAFGAEAAATRATVAALAAAQRRAAEEYERSVRFLPPSW
jgi:hypothetical protein